MPLLRKKGISTCISYQEKKCHAIIKKWGFVCSFEDG